MLKRTQYYQERDGDK